MTNNTNQILMDVEAAIQGAETVLPTVLGVVGAFYAPAKAIIPFLPLLQVALNSLQQVETVLQGDTTAAVQTVTNSLQALPSTVTPPSTAPAS